MTHRVPSDAGGRSRTRRAFLASAGVGAVAVAAVVAGPTETVAGFTDSIFAGGGLSASSFGIQSSAVFDDSGFDDHSDPPVAMVTTPVTVAPGGTSYAPVYLRTTTGTGLAATVSMSQPAPGSSNSTLWNTYIQYRAKAIAADSGTTCNAALLNAGGGTHIVNAGTTLAATPPSLPSFDLQAKGGDKVMVCFEFTLLSDVVTGAPSANGQSVTPTWTFTAEPQS